MNVMLPTSNEPSKEAADLAVGPLDDDPIVLGLKRLYDSVLEEPVPEEFLAILVQIDETLEASTAPVQISNGADHSADAAPRDRS